ncbi:DUF488 domain-containing protein [Phycicoccus sp. HDW14]|uniref:DUF488 domain-containing protein n=1 Tax=Phycicoccus sp. HDW14 TaxID=2714941 RepID=UPI0035303F46
MSLKRIYDEPAPEDGYRVLVDRIWPRGLSHDRARIDEWVSQVAPSTQLRTWYGHDPARFEEFERRYRAELSAAQPAAALSHLGELAHTRAQAGLTLLTATRRSDISHAAVLVHLLTTPESSTTHDWATG